MPVRRCQLEKTVQWFNGSAPPQAARLKQSTHRILLPDLPRRGGCRPTGKALCLALITVFVKFVKKGYLFNE